MEKQKRAIAVSKVENKTTFPVPNLFKIKGLAKLDTIVEPTINIESNPAIDIGICKSDLITGHAAPNIESGKPKLINEI